MNPALNALRRHVTGAIERGEGDAIVEMPTPAGTMRRHPAVAFRDVPRGALFECNGNVWRKVSTRTALIYWPAGPSRSFYFRMGDVCHTERAR